MGPVHALANPSRNAPKNETKHDSRAKNKNFKKTRLVNLQTAYSKWVKPSIFSVALT